MHEVSRRSGEGSAALLSPGPIHGAGEMAELMRRHDWSGSPLGPPDSWSETLLSAVNLILASPIAMALYWGPDHAMVYNDGCRAFMGARHPLSLGQPGAVVWAEAWHIVGPQIEAAYTKGETTFQEDALVPIEKDGRMEDCYWTYTYSPVRDSRQIVGVFNLCHSTTAAVVTNRQLRASEARARRVLESIGDAVIVTNEHGVITSINPVAEQLTGWAETDAQGLPLTEIFHMVDETTREAFEGPADKVKRLGTAVQLANHTVLVRGDAPDVAIDHSAAPIFDEQGALTGVVLVFRDVGEKRAVDRALRASEEQTRFALETARLGIWTIELKTGHATRNLRHDSIFGYTEVQPSWTFEQFLGHVVAEDREYVARQFHDAIGGGADWEGMASIIRVDGERRHIWFKGRHVRDSQGNSVQVTGLVADITDRRRADEALRESEMRFRSVADTVPGSLYELEPDGRIRFVNRWFIDFTGRNMQILLRDGWMDLIHEEDLHRVQALRSTAIRSQTGFSYEFRLRHHSGVYRWLQTVGRPCFDAAGLLTHWTGAAFDTTERRQAEEALRFSEESFRNLFELAPVGVCMSDVATERILFANAEASRITGYSSEEMATMGTRAFTHPEDQASNDTLYQRLMEAGATPTVTEKRYLRKDGETVWVRVTARMAPHFEGDSMRTFAVIQNVTDSRLAQAALLQTEKLAVVGRLAASIAHEINNPLEAVTNLLYLARTSPGGTEIQGYLDTAEQELRRVAAIASQTLRFHRQSTKPRPVCCVELIGSVLAIYQGRISNAQIIVEKRKRANSEVMCLDGEIRQVLSNLIGNAIDALPPQGGRMVLRSRDGTDWRTGRRGLVLTVADNGCGMSEKTRRKIFDAFYTTKGNNGTGLGLWVSSEIVERHQGRLLLRTSQSNQHHGTVFAMFLPFETKLQSAQNESSDAG